jgi:hypothetical protein
MSPYFLNLNERIVDDELSLILLDIANKNVESFRDYRGGMNNDYDGNSTFSLKNITPIPKIQELKNSCILNFYPILFMHRPNIIVKKHRDDPNKRNCVLVTPLAPKENYAPTNFFQNFNDEEPVATCDFSNFNSVFLNTQQIHYLKNYDVYRFNVQFCFNESFEVVTDLYQKGQLFNN